jgi:hypothetical protein
VFGLWGGLLIKKGRAADEGGTLHIGGHTADWQGQSKYCFCDKEEEIQLFFNCPLAKIIWRIVHMSFGISPQKNVSNLFGNWLLRLGKNIKSQIRVSICPLLWAIWHVCDDFIFNKLKNASFLQVITALKPYMVMSPAGGAPLEYRFWVKPLGDGCNGFIQPVRLAA